MDSIRFLCIFSTVNLMFLKRAVSPLFGIFPRRAVTNPPIVACCVSSNSIPNISIQSCIARLCRDSIPDGRRQLVHKLVDEDIGSQVGSAQYYELEDLTLLGICEKSSSGWSLKPELRERIAAMFSHFD